jgi:hypothetical protein
MGGSTREVRLLYHLGMLLLLGGLVHIVVWWILGGPWAGPVAWRKPILFGISGGVTCLSIDWVFGRFVRPWGWDRYLARAFAVAMTVEVGLITLQVWRGVPSHFNDGTPFDAAVGHIMFFCIVLVTVLVGLLTIRSGGPLRSEPAMALALRAGLFYLLLACAAGFLITRVGGQLLLAGRSPDTYGKAGVLKFPHGMPLHAIQMLPALAWLTAAAGWTVVGRLRAVGIAVVGQAILTVYSFVQTFHGRGRGELTPESGTLLAVGMLAVGAPFALAVTGTLRRRLRGSTVLPTG